ncbi:MAG: YitT family protein [Clostridia bacterium]|nr:YitT family protein [Clostridia bacterium]
MAAGPKGVNMSWKQILRTLPVVVLGNFIMAAGIVLFILPAGLITGGTTGLGIIMEHVSGVSIPVFMAVFNVAMFLLGFLCLGKTFAASTLVSTFISPVAVAAMQAIVGDFVLCEDLLMNVLFGGICVGAAIAIVVRAGSSTGGMDIPPLLLQKYLGIPVSRSLYVFDFLIVCGQAVVVAPRMLLYGVLLVMVYTVVIDKMMAMGDAQIQLQIVSPEADAIRQAILQDVDRGVTLLHGQTGYFQRETDVLFTIISPRERHRTEQLIRRIDPHAFIIISHVTRVSGGGFSLPKRHLPLDQ